MPLVGLRAVPLPLMQPAADAHGARRWPRSPSARWPCRCWPMSRPTEATDPDHVRRLLVEQVTGRVRWRESMLALRALGVDTTVEFGGNKVLTGMVKRIDKELADRHARYARRNRSFRERRSDVRPHRKRRALGHRRFRRHRRRHRQGAARPGRDRGAVRHPVEALEALKAELGARAFIAACQSFRHRLGRSLAQGGGRRGGRAASTSWSTMPASPATISSCA